MKIEYIHEPTPLQCGQAVLAMVAAVSVAEIVRLLDNDRETTLKEMRDTFAHYGFVLSPERVQVQDKGDLPPLALLSLETPRCWHWSLFCEGVFYDPEHGVMSDFPQAKRKYYWKIDSIKSAADA